MIDIVVPLGNGSPHNNWELRTTLRSIEANMTGVGRVYCVGNYPEWASPELIHVPGNWRLYGKAYQIFLKMLAGAAKAGSGQFIGWSDDTPMLQPMEASELPVYYNSTLAHWSTLSINRMYLEIVRNTHRLFPDGLFYNVHTPALYDTEKYAAMATDLDWSRGQYLVKSSYFNLHPPTSTIEIPDPKIGPNGLPDLPFVSFPSRVPAGIMRQMEEMFPNKSRWEK